MPDYGVGAGDWQPLPWSWAAERLVPNRNYWVVTVSGAGRPHSLPVWGVWDDDDQRFMFSCGPRARKARNLLENPRAAVTTDDTVECVSLEGTAEVVSDAERRELWIERYMAKYGPVEPSLTAEILRQHQVIEFTPDRALAVIERADEFATRPTRWVFDR